MSKRVLYVGEGTSIAEVACIIMPIIESTQSTVYNGALEWIQASFTAEENGKFTGDPIETYQDLIMDTVTTGSFQASRVEAFLN